MNYNWWLISFYGHYGQMDWQPVVVVKFAIVTEKVQKLQVLQ